MPVDDDGIVRVDSPNGLYQIHGCKVRGGEPPRTGFFCTYSAILTPKITVAAHFADYRAMCGLPFVERVLSLIKEKLCEFGDCTIEHVHAATLRSEFRAEVGCKACDNAYSRR